MLNTESYVTLAGNPSKWDNEVITTVRPGRVAGCYNSEDLCRVQVSQYNRGYRTATLVVNYKGEWYVRSGMFDKNILAHPFETGGTREGAIAWGKAWAETDADSREFYAHKGDLK